MARCIWAWSDEELVERMAENRESSATIFNFEMQESLNHDQFTMMTVTLWSISYARHKEVYEINLLEPRLDSFFHHFVFVWT